MKHLSVLIKPASSSCNLRCKYCFYHNISDLREVKSFGKMKEETMISLIDNVFKDLENGDHISFVFQGGEPTLAGLDYFKNFVIHVKQQTKKVVVHYTFQTNGILITKEWCTFFKENNFLVGLSIDPGMLLHDENRLDSLNRGTFERVMEAKRLFDKCQVEYNVLSVLTREVARYPQEIFEFLKENQIKYVQFIPCLDEFQTLTPSDYALRPENFAQFYKAIFPLWKEEKQIGIGLLDSLVTQLIYNLPATCGIDGYCRPQFVIEADGSVYPCDFYVLDEYKVGNIIENTLLDCLRHEKMQEFLCQRPEVKDICKGCPYLRMCNGGCKRMKNSMYVNESGTYCGYQDFLNDTISELKALGLQLKSYN